MSATKLEEGIVGVDVVFCYACGIHGMQKLLFVNNCLQLHYLQLHNTAAE